MLDGIPPAPRGVPQIEVTFDIDANGILERQAPATRAPAASRRSPSRRLERSDQGRNREDGQAQAEAPRADDKARREAIELRNQAESMAYQADRTLSDYGEKVPAELKAESESKMPQCARFPRDGSRERGTVEAGLRRDDEHSLARRRQHVRAGANG